MPKQEAVVFGFPNPDGTITYKSNDPYWNAEQLLKSRDAEDDDSDEAIDTGDEFDKLKAPELKAKAAELGVDLTGLKKVGEVRQALRDKVAADAAAEADDSEEE